MAGRQRLFLPVLAAIVSGVAPVGAAPRTCSIVDLVSLHSCFDRLRSYDEFSIDADVRCTSDAACCPDNHAPLLFQGVANKQIDGNGHVLRREAGQHKCPVIVLKQARGILIRDLALDEDHSSPPCELAESTCPNTINVADSQDVRFDRIGIYDGKGYVLRVWATDGFIFSRSIVADAGIIGLYVGHYDYGPSRNVAITGSVFAHCRTNGIALQGADSPDPAHPVLVADNVFIDNHWHGLWPIPGGVTTGGQLYLAAGQNIRVTGNTISAHPCENCFGSQYVPGIEIGEPNSTSPRAGAHGVVIDDNLLLGTGEARPAIYQNVASVVSDVTISNNRVRGYARLDNLSVPAGRERNQVIVPLSR